MDEHVGLAPELLRDHPFFSDLPEAAVAPLAAHAHARTVPAGDVLFHEREPADRFFLLRSGEIRLSMEDAGRGQVPVDVLADDAVLGWSWLFAPYRWHLTATALRRTTLIEFDADRLRQVMSDDPELGYQLMRRFAALLFDRLQATRRRLTSSSEASA